MKQKNIALYAMPLSLVFLLTACGGGGGYQEILTTNLSLNPDTNQEKEIPKVLGDGGIVLEPNKEMPKDGEFLSPSFENNYEKNYSPTVYYTGEEKRKGLGYDLETARGGRLFLALRKIIYTADGKLEAIYMGNQVDHEAFKYKLNDKLQKLTSYEESGKQTRYDAGLKVGGQYAGVYAAEGDSVPYAFFWRDPATAGWNYQTYGMFDSGNRFVNIGAVEIFQSIGEYTQNIPTGGEATYNGIASGNGVRGGKIYATTADVSVNVDFGMRKVDFQTSNTKKYEFDSNNKLKDGFNASDLDLKASLALKKGEAGFTGEIKTADDSMKGDIRGLFYGPNADEIGGIFGVQKEENGDYLIGGFGARRE
ncbi:hypothetical protein A1D23_04895 [Chelonobacter oris]|uniref:transferrin-binding protein-like solute binding protein n=1 Tax=Chelonobacter oris TaxID=505317 RepID=UPI002447202C|nr:transferrin-binding protein-like solute binding protein [Chelonobacter oris]MDH2999437.1 hypothetical protein [Chelonobacter oris]